MSKPGLDMSCSAQLESHFFSISDAIAINNTQVSALGIVLAADIKEAQKSSFAKASRRVRDTTYTSTCVRARGAGFRSHVPTAFIKHRSLNYASPHAS